MSSIPHEKNKEEDKPGSSKVKVRIPTLRGQRSYPSEWLHLREIAFLVLERDIPEL